MIASQPGQASSQSCHRRCRKLFDAALDEHHDRDDCQRDRGDRELARPTHATPDPPQQRAAHQNGHDDLKLHLMTSSWHRHAAAAAARPDPDAAADPDAGLGALDPSETGSVFGAWLDRPPLHPWLLHLGFNRRRAEAINGLGIRKTGRRDRHHDYENDRAHRRIKSYDAEFDTYRFAAPPNDVAATTAAAIARKAKADLVRNRCWIFYGQFRAGRRQIEDLARACRKTAI